MRSVKEMFDLIINTAKNDDRIRAVYMNGSRTNPNVKKDIFQDYDIVYVVTETESFIKDKNWVDVFGKKIIMQLPDESDKILYGKDNFSRSYGYLMQFTDGNRIDLTIETPDMALEKIKNDKLTIVLLDKDNILPVIPEPTDKDYWVKRPTQELFNICCNEFWWVILYIAKGLWREEIPYAMDCLNYWVRPQLMKMLSWYAGFKTNFSCSMGKSGKNLKEYIPEDMWKRYLKTYPCAEISSIWDSVFIMADLFEETAVKVSDELNLKYNFEEASNSKSYLKHISELSQDAKEIY